MSARSREARTLANELTARTTVRVELVYERPGEWLASWGDGPTRDQMHDLIGELQRSGQYPQMAGQQVRTTRLTSARAWAAQAIAADREGRLRTAVAARVADLAANPYRVRMTGSTLTDEDSAVLLFVDDILEVTAYPDRPQAPADAAAIERLIAASGNSEYRMARLVLAPAGSVSAELPEGVTALHDRRRRAGQ